MYLETVHQKCLIEEHYVVCVSSELLLCLNEDELLKSLCEEQDLGLTTICDVKNKYINCWSVQWLLQPRDVPDIIFVIYVN